METQVPPSQIHITPGGRNSVTYSSPYGIKDYSTFASKQNDNNRRFFFFGDYEVGKTSLWLRYIYYDQRRANVAVD